MREKTKEQKLKERCVEAVRLMLKEWEPDIRFGYALRVDIVRAVLAAAKEEEEQ